MPYRKEIFDAATAKLEARRRAAESENALARNELYAKIPRLLQIERELAQTGIAVAREILSHADTAACIEELRKKNLSLQEERAQLLSKNGYPPEILTINYYCSECRDTGYVGDKMCSCLKSLLLEEACKSANSGSPLPLLDFDSFDLHFYPETELPGQHMTVRSYMGRVLAHCRHYAVTFDGSGGSLLMLGQTGLGKTHLALAIARAVLARGYGVIYDTSQNIFSHLDEELYSHGQKRYTETVFTCDLLILDDLPEFASPSMQNTLYNIINTRTLARRPMIVSTNLTEPELSARYGQKIFSRLIGEFMMLKFFGSDIRQLKLRQGSNIHQ